MMLPTRIKLLAGTVVVCGGLAAAAVQGVFAAPAPVVTASTATPAATATTTPAISTTAPTTSSAPSPSTGTPPGPRAFHRGGPGPGGFGGPGNLSGLATFLGMNTTDLQTALKGGQTMAAIAQAHGKSSSDLITYLTGQLKTRLDQLVASGKLTSAREATILNNANTRFSKLINLNFQQLAQRPPRRGPGPGFGGPANLSGVASFLGMTQTDLQTALKNGQTLAQIAQAQGKSSSDLITYLTGQLKTRLDQLVASGKLTSAREATILNNANTRFSKLINLNFQQAMAHRGAGRGHRAPATAPTATPTP